MDFHVIQSLATDVESPALAIAFLGDYLAMLPRRADRILARITDQDRGSAMDAIISLRSSSAMSGASRVEATCRKMESLVSQGSFRAAEVESRNLTDAVRTLTLGAPFLMEQAKKEFGPAAANQPEPTSD